MQACACACRHVHCICALLHAHCMCTGASRGSPTHLEVYNHQERPHPPPSCPPAHLITLAYSPRFRPAIHLQSIHSTLQPSNSSLLTPSAPLPPPLLLYAGPAALCGPGTNGGHAYPKPPAAQSNACGGGGSAQEELKVSAAYTCVHVTACALHKYCTHALTAPLSIRT